jgi:hypothetical protein
MREIRQLEPAPAGDEQPRPRSWSPWRGVPFAVGALIAVVTLGAAGFLASQLPLLETEDVLPEAGAVVDSQIDAMPVDELWDMWAEVTASTLGEQFPPEHVQARRVRRDLLRRIYVLLAIAAVSASVAAGCVLWKPGHGRTGQEE